MSKFSCTTGKCARENPPKTIHKQDASSNSCTVDIQKNILTVSLKICLFLLKPSSGRYLAQLYITAPTAETSETVVFYRPRRPKKLSFANGDSLDLLEFPRQLSQATFFHNIFYHHSVRLRGAEPLGPTKHAAIWTPSAGKRKTLGEGVG